MRLEESFQERGQSPRGAAVESKAGIVNWAGKRVYRL